MVNGTLDHSSAGFVGCEGSVSIDLWFCRHLWVIQLFSKLWDSLVELLVHPRHSGTVPLASPVWRRVPWVGYNTDALYLLAMNLGSNLVWWFSLFQSIVHNLQRVWFLNHCWWFYLIFSKVLNLYFLVETNGVLLLRVGASNCVRLAILLDSRGLVFLKLLFLLLCFIILFLLLCFIILCQIIININFCVYIFVVFSGSLWRV